MSEDDSSVTIVQLYEEIIKSRKELKNAIEASENRVLLKLEHLSNKVTKLERENEELKDKIEKLETYNKKNNIVIFGLDTPPKNVQLVHSICQELKRLLNIDIIEADINNVFSLRKTTNGPIKVEFNTYLKKIEVLQNCKKLRGTSVRIAHDLTLKQRETYKALQVYLKKAKGNPANKCYIKGNKLYINNKSYTVEELEESGEYIFQNQSSNSAPSILGRNIQVSEQPGEKQYKRSEKVITKPTESNAEHSQEIQIISMVDASKGKIKTTGSVVGSGVKTRSADK